MKICHPSSRSVLLPIIPLDTRLILAARHHRAIDNSPGMSRAERLALEVAIMMMSVRM